MRIISQDGNYDYPYENSVVCRVENKILIQNPIDGKLKVIAVYEDEEDADEALKYISGKYVFDVGIVKMPKLGDEQEFYKDYDY